MLKRIFILSLWAVFSIVVIPAKSAYSQDLPSGISVIPNDALLTSPVGGLEKTNAAQEIIPVTSQPFDKALRVTIRKDAPQSNATQMTILNSSRIEKGDVIYISFYIRGPILRKSSQIIVLFEKATTPWNNSVVFNAAASKDSDKWTRIMVPFTSVESYQAGEAMTSLRLALGPQTVDIGGLEVINLGKSVMLSDLIKKMSFLNRLGKTKVNINFAVKFQKILGLGGNFCQARYGHTVDFDNVGRYNLNHFNVAQARIGIPLNNWVPNPPVNDVLSYHDDAQAHATFLTMQEMCRRKIPIIGTVWEGPVWMLGGHAEESNRILPADKYAVCIEAISRFLVTARDKYGVVIDYYSFNEADWGVNFLFTPKDMANFIRQAGKRFDALGLKTKFLVGDTTGGAPFVAYSKPLLNDPTISRYLGPLAFHCWDALSTTDETYSKIGELVRSSGKVLYCSEGGYDAALWKKDAPWDSWDNGLLTAQAYVKTLQLTGASAIDYWTYEDNYPIVSSDGKRPYKVFFALKQLEDALPKGSNVVSSLSDSDALRVVATKGPSKGQYTVILVNPIGNGTVSLSGLPGNSKVSVVVSNDNAQYKTVNHNVNVSKSGILSLALTPRSVVTIIGAVESAIQSPK